MERDSGKTEQKPQIDHKSILKSLHHQLADKAKHVDDLQNQNFMLKQTVSRENVDLKLKYSDASSKLQQREYGLKLKTQELTTAAKYIEQLKEEVRSLTNEAVSRANQAPPTPSSMRSGYQSWSKDKR